MAIRIEDTSSDLPAVLILHLILSIFPFPFLISTSLFVRLRSSIDFYSAKVSQVRKVKLATILRKMYKWGDNWRLCGYAHDYTV